MSMISGQKIKAFFLAIILIGSLTAASAIDILHAGVKINSTPLQSDKFLLTRDELDKFIISAENAKLLTLQLNLANEKSQAYQMALASISAELNISIRQSESLADRLSQSADERKKLNNANKQLKNKNASQRVIIGSLVIGIITASLINR